MRKEYLVLVLALTLGIVLIVRFILGTQSVSVQTIPSAPASRTVGGVNPVLITLLSPQVITTSSTTTSYGVDYYREALGYMAATVTSGTVTMTWQTSPDKTTWYTHTTSTAIAASGNTIQSLSAFGPYLRGGYDISAGGNITLALYLSLKE